MHELNELGEVEVMEVVVAARALRDQNRRSCFRMKNRKSIPAMAYHDFMTVWGPQTSA